MLWMQCVSYTYIPAGCSHERQCQRNFLLADIGGGRSSQLCLVPQRDWAKSIKEKKAARVTSRRLLVQKEPVLSSTLLTAPLLTAALLTATLFFTLALLTFALLSLFILLLAALLSRGRGFARFVWILLCIHDAFLCY